MSDWTNPVSGLWSDAAKWTGGVPDAPGAVASFKVGPTFGTPLIRLSQNETITIGTLDLEIAIDSGLFIFGATAASNATLRFQGAGGGPAFINVDSNGSTSVGISGTNDLEVALLSDLIVT